MPDKSIEFNYTKPGNSATVRVDYQAANALSEEQILAELDKMLLTMLQAVGTIGRMQAALNAMGPTMRAMKEVLSQMFPPERTEEEKEVLQNAADELKDEKQKQGRCSMLYCTNEGYTHNLETVWSEKLLCTMHANSIGSNDIGG